MECIGLVTGAASGIGLKTAKRLLKKGWVVYGLDNDENNLHQAEAEIDNTNFIPKSCDLRNEEALVSVLNDIKISIRNGDPVSDENQCSHRVRRRFETWFTRRDVDRGFRFGG